MKFTNNLTPAQTVNTGPSPAFGGGGGGGGGTSLGTGNESSIA